MAVALVTGALVGAAVGELLKAVLEAKDKAMNFKPMFKSLESTLQLMVPRVNRLSRLNQKLNLHEDQLKEFITILREGEQLVRKCLKVSSINFVRKVQYAKELLDLDNCLLRYLQTILLLDQAGDTKEILVVMRELRTLLKGDKEEEIISQTEFSAACIESDLLTKDNGDENINNHNTALSVPAELPSKDQSFVPQEDAIANQINEEQTELLSQDPQKKRHRRWWFRSHKEPKQTENLSHTEPVRTENSDEKEGRNKLVLLEGCPYNFDLEDILRSDAEVMGKGTFGSTYRAYGDFGEIVVKRVKNFKVINKTDFQQRISYLGKIGRHPNVMPPFGFYFSKDEQLLLYDYAPGNLYAILHENSDSGKIPLDWNSRLKIALGAARGISHLHSEGGIHGNIKSSNVLLTQDFEGCISEYGLAPLVNNSESTPKKPGYHAPEITETWRATQKSDVYNFGVTLLEILTGKSPTGIDLVHWVVSIVREDWTAKIFDLQLMRENYEEAMVQTLQIAVQCTVIDPNNRPKMDDVVRMIESVRLSP